MKQTESIHVVVYYPKTNEGLQQLEQRAAAIHADYINSQIQQLQCSGQQKLERINAMIEQAEYRHKKPKSH